MSEHQGHLGPTIQVQPSCGPEPQAVRVGMGEKVSHAVFVGPDLDAILPLHQAQGRQQVKGKVQNVVSRGGALNQFGQVGIGQGRR